jgi:acid stress-induced BolA-like protein IbaG/YrbA
MFTTSALRTLLEAELPGAQVEVQDLTGGGDHFELHVTWSRFAGLGLLDQHRLVHAPLAQYLGGAIHAVKIKTRLPSSGN